VVKQVVQLCDLSFFRLNFDYLNFFCVQMPESSKPPIIDQQHLNEPTVFQPVNLLREARRQKNIKECPVPEICVLDPDGDLVRYLKRIEKTERNRCWACYHSELYSYDLDGTEIGIIPCAVGAPYAVLIAEQLFVSGCRLLVSVTSAGIITDEPIPKQFALITESERDEGTSYHYLAKEMPARISAELHKKLTNQNDDHSLFFEAKSWTTDAPYRETKSAILAMKEKGITCVEMEAAALYAFAEYSGHRIVCYAHLTNSMAQFEGDFEKGEEFGSLETLQLISQTINMLTS